MATTERNPYDDAMQQDLTTGPAGRNLLRFSIPYLASSFLQTFYGMTDLFVTGKFNGAEAISAVAIGSQVMHMLTVMIVGLAMGTTVNLGKAVGAKDQHRIGQVIGNSVWFFTLVGIFTTFVLVILTDPILYLLSTPSETFTEAHAYLLTCMLGIPCIIAYNVVVALFRGQGDSRTPLFFIAIAGVANILLDWYFIGPLGMGAQGAALATVISQALSFLLALVAILKMKLLSVKAADFRPDGNTLRAIVSTGLPICLQDAFVQVSFLLITIIVNRRGVIDAAAVGIVEKLISFLFLVPSAMLSSVSAIASQNAGAGHNDRSLRTLWSAMAFSAIFGLVVTVIVQFTAESIVALFTTDSRVITQGADYFHSYVFDCFFASFHFSMSGFFCAYEHADYSFLSNVLSIVLVRIPGAWWGSIAFPNSLWPMGWAAPCGSLFSSIVCAILMRHLWKKGTIRP